VKQSKAFRHVKSRVEVEIRYGTGAAFVEFRTPHEALLYRGIGFRFPICRDIMRDSFSVRRYGGSRVLQRHSLVCLTIVFTRIRSCFCRNGAVILLGYMYILIHFRH